MRILTILERIQGCEYLEFLLLTNAILSTKSRVLAMYLVLQILLFPTA